MASEGTRRKRYGTAYDRWEGLGPYYAMFPSWFADETIGEFTRQGDVVLDPFAGRGTSLFSAVKAGRFGVGAELSPVGWIYAKTKLAAADLRNVGSRLEEIAEEPLTPNIARYLAELPSFFDRCFSPAVLGFLVKARARLDWRASAIDRTLMAHVLVYLHGKRTAALSNQMRQTKAMAPNYSVRWWADQKLDPPDVDPVNFLSHRLKWRYRHGTPVKGRGSIVLGDCTRHLNLVGRFITARGLRPASLLLTSPPYFGVTNYHYDQWLRLWMLGGPPQPEWIKDPHRNRFENAAAYKLLLSRSLAAASRLMRSDAVVYVRTGASDSCLQPLLTALAEAFPRYAFEVMEQSYTGRSQSELFIDADHARLKEVDVVGVRRVPIHRRTGSTSAKRPVALKQEMAE